MRTRIGERKTIDDVRAMRALAHPERLGILLFLLSGEPKTATECAEEVNASPSACSYHLRELERFGFVERAETTGDGRTRPWRPTAVGFSVGNDWTDDSLVVSAARQAITQSEMAENRRLIHRFLEAVDDLDQEWRAAVDFHTFELFVTPDELRELNEQVADLLRPFRPTEIRDASDRAAAVHVVYQAFPRISAR
jgi:DNA-binding MarR family transcriptional regulator